MNYDYEGVERAVTMEIQINSLPTHFLLPFRSCFQALIISRHLDYVLLLALRTFSEPVKHKLN